MARCQTHRARITGSHVTTGQRKVRLEDDPLLAEYAPNRLERLRQAIGLNTRYIASADVTALDLCSEAWTHLRSRNQIDEQSLDGVIFVTQTPDYFQPGNAHLFHGRFKLPKSCVCFDLTQGCSGWVQGWYLASLLIESGSCRRVLLLAGDTLCRTVHPADAATVPLFGDAGSATLIEAGDDPVPTWFCLSADGASGEAIRHAGAAFRHRSDPNLDQVETREDGGAEGLQFLRLDGGAVFNFSLREIPPALEAILEFAEIPKEAVDRVFLHQANRYIIESIARKAGFDLQKVPSLGIAEFGNQSSASLPGVLAACQSAQFPAKPVSTHIYCGYGVGLSWATALTSAPAFEASWNRSQALGR